MMDDLIALAGDLVFERKRLSESLRRLEGALLRGENARELFKAMGVQDAEGLHAELELLARGLERIGALTKTIVHQVNHDRLVECFPLLREASQAIELASSKLSRPVVIECRHNDVKFDRETAERFKPVLFEMLETLVEYCVESAKERSARRKRPKAYFQLEVKPTEDGYRLMVVCDGNGILPPLSHDHGLKLAEIGVRASFEGKPGQWSAWVYHLPIGFGAFNCVYVESGGRKFCIPALAVSSARAVAPAKGAVWTIDGEINRTQADGDLSDRKLVEISAGTDQTVFAFDESTNPEEVFMKPLHEAFSGNGRFLGVVAIEGAAGQNELCLVLNPAYLVYGDEALLDSAKDGRHAI